MKKKIIYILLLTILLIPIGTHAAKCDTSKIYIDSIGREDKAGNVTELEQATAEDKTINVNLKMKLGFKFN